ncbi:MAG: c-type cytochrome [Gemmatimonadota bacterium]|nr:c-type cytochrome [Gemmatimonadota bacterium]
MSAHRIARLAAIPAAFALFACGGSHTTPAASAPAPSANVAAASNGGLPADVTPAMVAAGDSLFNAPRSCNGCHGKGGTNGRNGPDLTTGKYEHTDGSYAGIVKVITDGIPKNEIKHPEHRFPMRPRGGHDYSDEQIRTLAAYVWTLGHRQ